MTMKPNLTLDRLWRKFHQGVLSSVPQGSIQYRDAESTFYAGCLTLITALRDELSELDEDEVAAVLEQMKREGIQFFEESARRQGQ